jgi:hypothetical protein
VMAVSASSDHQRLVDETIAYFQEQDITCIDFEEHVGVETRKRPDLLLPDFNTLLEVKTFAPQEREIEEAHRIGKELSEGETSAYWHPTFYDRFGDHLRSARQKFRIYPNYNTAVLLYDLHSFVHAQTPEELLRGEEYYEFGYLKDDPEQTVLVDYGYKKRHLRRDVNHEIGAVVFHTGQNTFRVFHNHFAEKIRRIDKGIFALSEDEHFEYIDDSVNPQIIKLEEQ